MSIGRTAAIALAGATVAKLSAHGGYTAWLLSKPPFCK